MWIAPPIFILFNVAYWISYQHAEKEGECIYPICMNKQKSLYIANMRVYINLQFISIFSTDDMIYWIRFHQETSSGKLEWFKEKQLRYNNSCQSYMYVFQYTIHYSYRFCHVQIIRMPMQIIIWMLRLAINQKKLYHRDRKFRMNSVW